MRQRRIGWGVVLLLSLLTVLLVSPYLSLNPELFFPEQRAVYSAHLATLFAHVAGGIVTLTLGPFLFLNSLRARRPAVHRWLGRVYLLGVLIGGVAALPMALRAYGGGLASAGFAAVGLLWLATGLLAFTHIRAGDVQAHRRWMIRNFALSFAAVSLRFQSPLLSALIGFEAAYPIVAWSSWGLNLLVAEWLIRSQRGRGRAVAVRAAASPDS